VSGAERDLVLVVDDDPDARAFLAHALAADGYASAAAKDGVAGLALAEQLRPGLILMDAVMPGLSGFEACRLLKGEAELAHIPVIFMTGLSETEHVVQGFQAGGVDYVTKPVVLEELLARIRVHLANAQLSMSARSALDVAGRALVAVDGGGRVIWKTPQAARLLAGDGGEPDADLSAALRELAQEAREIPPVTMADGRRMQLALVGRSGEERFVRLSESIEGREQDLLRGGLKLTAREADVLLWISRGKSNRDVSEILNISARTVNKHLEQVFTKLGVENRAAAAAIATRIIAAST
jgi:DNA-binding NarL/FixJ family response regulator